MSKLTGRRVSMAPNRARRSKRDSNALGDADDEVAGGASGRRKNAIFNEEIARLRIREEDLVKVSQEARAASGASSEFKDDPEAGRVGEIRRVAVRKEIPEALRRPPLKRVVLLKRALPGASQTGEFRSTDNAIEWRCNGGGCGDGSAGPRLDSRGNVVAHSLLGRPEEFYRIGLLRGQLTLEDVPQAYLPDKARQLPEPVDGDVVEDQVQALRFASFNHHQMLCSGPFNNEGQSARVRNKVTRHRSTIVTGRVSEHGNQCGFTSPMKHPQTDGGGGSSRCADSNAVRRRSEQSATNLSPPAGTSLAGPSRSVNMSGPQFSFIGGWSYQKAALLNWGDSSRRY